MTGLGSCTQIPGKTQRKSQFDPKIFFSDETLARTSSRYTGFCEAALETAKMLLKGQL